jgi:hypothetical protein
VALSKSLSNWVNRVAKAAAPLKPDLMLIGNYVKAQILDRTERGVDADGRPFAPYNTTRPFYWNPYTGKNISSWQAQNRSMNRMLKKLGAGNNGILRDGKGKELARRGGTGTSIRFQSYDAFKRSLGRSNVDLTGPRAPHMLQALQVRAVAGGVTVGIYGEAAARAAAHNAGVPGRLPQRRFLGATTEDRQHILKLLSTQVRGRIKKATPGR